METFYQRPGTEQDSSGTEYRKLPISPPPNLFARWAQILGVIAVVSTFTFTVYPPFIFGSLAVILALLSKGKEKNMHKNAKTGVILSCSSVVINVMIIIMSLTVIFGSGQTHDEFNAVFEQMYGQTFEEMMEDIESGDFDYDEFYDNYGL